jgi:hypothetical protein
MGVGRHGREVIDGDHFDVGVRERGPQEKTTNPAKAVDGDACSHYFSFYLPT